MTPKLAPQPPPPAELLELVRALARQAARDDVRAVQGRDSSKE
jgi:hypothetical protein